MIVLCIFDIICTRFTRGVFSTLLLTFDDRAQLLVLGPSFCVDNRKLKSKDKVPVFYTDL